MITLDFEIVEELNKLENKSGFINKLLIDYFNMSKPLEIKKEELTKKAEEIIDEVNEINKNIEKVEEQNLKQKAVWEEEQKVYNNSDERWINVRNMMKDAFENVDIPKENKEEYFEEFMNSLRDGLVKNLIEYMDIKALKFKEKKKEEI